MLAAGLATAGLAMAVIIAVQMGLSIVFTYQVGEVFSKVAVSALFYWSVLQLVKRRKSEGAK